ncbi:hypothetical protein [Hymenobacter psychrophilus]|uniref:DUF4177 domain-containing protein n=1 Tax=Hymenobacter psychrophilus TaxID=651662 RepID=A0A1H3EPT4_9BACT|nr:hypothetical protein [Hymenobacter psychrophilus]SDX80615.1 hypothetical protein SAMN04488069_103244 [Hymenobacter psychrophilus]
MLKSTLLLMALLSSGAAAAQKAQPALLAPLVAPSPLPVISVTPVAPTNGVRYEYQLVRLENDWRIIFAPAWRGQTVLEPDTKLFKGAKPGEVDGLLLGAINALSADGWELLEIRTSAQLLGAAQKVETSLYSSDPNRPQYDGKTTYSSDSQTRYLFRRALAR